MRVENYRKLEGPSVIGLFDLELDKIGFTFRNWKVIQSKKGGWFAVSPSFKDGERFADLVEVREDKRREFRDTLHELLKPFVEKKLLNPFVEK